MQYFQFLHNNDFTLSMLGAINSYPRLKPDVMHPLLHALHADIRMAIFKYICTKKVLQKGPEVKKGFQKVYIPAKKNMIEVGFKPSTSGLVSLML